MDKLFKGIFWIRDDLPLNESVPYCVLIPCDIDGYIDDTEQMKLTAKSTRNHNHKVYWNCIMADRLRNGKQFDYYPRGRVEIKKGIVTIFANPNICTSEIKDFLTKLYRLNSNEIKKIKMIADCSKHYKCHLDGGR